MAEIRVQPKPRSRAWLWVLLFLVLAAVAAWYAWSQGLIRVDDTAAVPVQTSAVALSAAPHATTPAPSAPALRS